MRKVQEQKEGTGGPVRQGVPDRPLAPVAVLQVLLLAAGWGGNAPALRYSLLHLPPNGSATLRFLIGTAVVVAIARWQDVPLRIRRETFPPLLLMSLLFAAQIAMLNYGSALTAASRQAVLLCSYPLYVPLIAHFAMRGDRITWSKASGTLLAFVGILLIFGERFTSQPGSLVGDVLVLLSGVLLAARVVYTAALVQGIHPFTLLFWQSTLALPIFLLLSVVAERPRYDWSPAVVVSIVYQGVVVAGLCFVGWTAMLRRYTPSRLSVGFFLTPVFGALFSHVLLREPITAGLVAGGAVILAGLFLANLRARALSRG